MVIKKSVYLIDDTIRLCNKLTKFDDKDDGNDIVDYSGSINSMAEQYKILINDCLPFLTEDQKNALYCVYNSYIPDSEIFQELKLLSINISESYQYNEQVRNFLGSEDEASEFIESVKKWSISQKLAVLFLAKSHWRSSLVVESDDSGFFIINDTRSFFGEITS